MDQLKPVDLCCLEGEPRASSLPSAFLQKDSDELAWPSEPWIAAFSSRPLRLRRIAWLSWHIQKAVLIFRAGLQNLCLCVWEKL